MRVVVDTNVIVSAYLGGALEGIIVAWRSGKFTLVVSREIAEEYLEVYAATQIQDRKSGSGRFRRVVVGSGGFRHPTGIVGRD